MDAIERQKALVLEDVYWTEHAWKLIGQSKKGDFTICIKQVAKWVEGVQRQLIPLTLSLRDWFLKIKGDIF